MATIKNVWKNNKSYIFFGFIVLGGIFIFRDFFVQKPVARAMKHFSVDSNNIIIEQYARGIALPGQDSTITAVAFSPDGNKMVSGGVDPKNNLLLWDISDLGNIKPIQLIEHLDMVNAVAFSPDGKKIISGGKGKRKNLILWDISDINNVKNIDFDASNEGVWAVAFSPDGSKIVSGSFRDKEDQSNCIIWDTATGQKIVNLDGGQSFVSSLAYSPDGSKIITGDWWGDENNLILWDVSDINNIQQIKLVGHPGQITGVAFSPDNSKIVSGGKGEHSNLIVWDIYDINKIKSVVLSHEYADVRSVAFSSDGSMIAEGNVVEMEELKNQNNITFWNAVTNKKITTLDGQQNGVWSIAFSPDDKQFVSGGTFGDHNLILWTLLF